MIHKPIPLTPMLSPADRDLVARDWRLRGLGTLLDEEAFREHLRGLDLGAGAGIEAAALTYLRYKPGTNCLARYWIRGGGESFCVYGKTRRDGEEEREREYVKDGVVARVFPDDGKLSSLAGFTVPEARRRFLERHETLREIPPESCLVTLNYKPERRFVGCLAKEDRNFAAVKVYTGGGFGAASNAARNVRGGDNYAIPRCLRGSRRRRALVFEWREGELLSERLGKEDGRLDVLRAVGIGLAELHRGRIGDLPVRSLGEHGMGLLAQARAVGELCPSLAGWALDLAGRISGRLAALPNQIGLAHGDFYAKQVLAGENEPCFLDFDEAMGTHPGWDVGNFLAHLEADALIGRHSDPWVASAGGLFTEAYAAASGRCWKAEAKLFTAARLFAHLPHFFRTRAPEWAALTKRGLERVSELLGSATGEGGGAAEIVKRSAAAPGAPRVQGLLGALLDERLPRVVGAADFEFMERQLGALLARKSSRTEWLGSKLAGIEILRHKPGRRCLLGYTLQPPAGPGAGLIRWIGKLSRKRLDAVTPEAARRLREAGLDGRRGVGIPEPVGAIEALHLQLQEKAPGRGVAEALLGSGAADLAGRCAAAVALLHGAGVTVARVHTLADELRILRDRFERTAAGRPWLAGRLARLLEACEAGGRNAGCPTPVLIHRDFYPDQLLADGERLWIVDLDLCAMGDPCLDHGNFLAHLTELSNRHFGHPDGLAGCEAAYLERALAGAGAHRRGDIEYYRTLSLARQVYLCTIFPERTGFLEWYLVRCEERLGLGAADVAEHSR